MFELDKTTQPELFAYTPRDWLPCDSDVWLYEDLFNLAQEESSQKLRDVEREKRLALEEQQRMYEQRSKEIEQSSKERERTIASSYESQLDKVKQSNARLIQQKS